MLYYSNTEVVNGDGSVTVTPIVGISGDDNGYCNIWSGFSGYEQAAVMLNGNAWQWSETQPSGGVNYGGYSLDWAYTFPNVTLPYGGGPVDLSYAAKVEGLCDWRSGLNFPNVYLSVFYSGEFVDGIAPGYSPAPCWIEGIINNPQCPAHWPYPYTTNPLGWHAADLASQQVAQQLTPSSHTYPNAPISTNCRVSTPFDAIINTTTRAIHAAQDISNTTHDLQVGAPVYAPEGGTVHIQGGYPHINEPASQCAGQHYPANYINITDANGNRTRLVHVTALPGLSEGQTVSAGQQVGTVDNSGCTSGPHVHMSRKQAGTVVNFTIPCDNSHFDSSGFYDDSDGLDNQ